MISRLMMRYNQKIILNKKFNMERETIIGVAFILIGVYLITFRRWLAKHQAIWASERGGILDRNVNSVSLAGHERNALVIGVLLLGIGSVILLRDNIDVRSLVNIELVAWGFFGLGVIGFGHALLKVRTVWSIFMSGFFLIASLIVLSRHLF